MRKIVFLLAMIAGLFFPNIESKAGCNYSFDFMQTSNGGWMGWVYTSNGDMAAYMYWTPEGGGVSFNGGSIYTPSMTITGGFTGPTGATNYGKPKNCNGAGMGTLHVHIYNEALLACEDFRRFVNDYQVLDKLEKMYDTRHRLYDERFNSLEW